MCTYVVCFCVVLRVLECRPFQLPGYLCALFLSHSLCACLCMCGAPLCAHASFKCVLSTVYYAQYIKVSPTVLGPVLYKLCFMQTGHSGDSRNRVLCGGDTHSCMVSTRMSRALNDMLTILLYSDFDFRQACSVLLTPVSGC